MNKLKWPLLIVALAVAFAGYLMFGRHHPKTIVNHGSTASVKSPSPTDSFNKQLYSLTDPTSLWVIVNKQHPISASYVPADLEVPSVPLRVPGNATMQLRNIAAQAMETMFSAAKAQGINLMLSSGYRSYSYQVSLYNSYVQQSGQAAADQFSARPGYSEHQTGLAADVEGADRTCEISTCFATTPEGQWLAANCYKYGFIIRYTTGNQAVTGYEPEPWHVRYVGIALATEMHNTGITTLEQFFGVSGGTTYKS